MSIVSNSSTAVRRFNRSNLSKAFSQVQWNRSGKVTDVIGNVLEAHLPGTPVGTVVRITVPNHDPVLCEVIGFRNEHKVIMLPFGQIAGISPGCSVTPESVLSRIPYGDFLLGRVIDPLMNGLDGDLPIPTDCPTTPIDRLSPNPLQRSRIEHPLQLGIRAIDGLMTFGEGQRMGIMAGAGVGKSVLLGMVARNTSAEINIIGLIGERGREVREFIERDLGEEGLRRSIVVVTTGDQSPLLRVRAAKVVTALAEAFSQQGKKVLLFMDSLTRVAMAQREIGQARDEAPTTKGYTTSVFSLLPALLERCGPQAKGQGSISGLYTVLVDGDDFNDPIPDAARSILDGHIQLSRSLANKGHFPAIDVTGSISRVMNEIVTEEHRQTALTLRALLGAYQENLDYIQIGAYQAGSNPTLDAAMALMPAIERFLRQDIRESSSLGQTLEAMAETLSGKDTLRHKTL